MTLSPFPDRHTMANPQQADPLQQLLDQVAGLSQSFLQLSDQSQAIQATIGAIANDPNLAAIASDNQLAQPSQQNQQAMAQIDTRMDRLEEMSFVRAYNGRLPEASLSMYRVPHWAQATFPFSNVPNIRSFRDMTREWELSQSVYRGAQIYTSGSLPTGGAGPRDCHRTRPRCSTPPDNNRLPWIPFHHVDPLRSCPIVKQKKCNVIATTSERNNNLCPFGKRLRYQGSTSDGCSLQQY
jgi:hypothetical protein